MISDQHRKGSELAADQGSRQQHKPRLPLSVLMLGGWMGVLGLVNLSRAIQAIELADFLSSLGLSLPPYLLAGVSAFWSLVFLLCAVGLWRLRPWARRATGIAALLYELTILAGRAIFARSDYARQTWPAALVWAGVTILVTWVLLSLPGARRAFTDRSSKQEADERR